MDKDIKARENRVRRKLAQQDCRLHKSRKSGCVYVNGVFAGLDADNQGGYMVIDNYTNGIVAGEHFDLSLEEVERMAEDD